MYNIQCNQSEPYANTIATFIKREFPVLVKRNDSDLLDILTDAILATGKIRLGPKNSPESLVAIRQVISHWVGQELPIPFLVPWGSEKPNGTGIDIAELFGMKTLNCLYHRVKEYYAPGLLFHIRVEDVSAPHLFFDRMEQARKEAALYTNGFVNLARVIGITSFVKIKPESLLTDEETFNAKADKILPIMENHVKDPMDQSTRDQLLWFGWKVPLSTETIGFYLDRYAKLYPEKTPAEQHHLLARYFAGALARHSLGITGADKDWGGMLIELSFTSPTSGIGADRAKRRIYYRTMPSDITSNHIPAWRAKGYLRINNENISAAMTNFNNKNLNFNPNVITLTDGFISQEIQADYVIES